MLIMARLRMQAPICGAARIRVTPVTAPAGTPVHGEGAPRRACQEGEAQPVPVPTHAITPLQVNAPPEHRYGGKLHELMP